MKRFAWLPLVLAAACAAENRLPEAAPEMTGTEPAPPDRFMERPPSFRFTDLREQKEYFLRRYEEGAIRMEIVTVREQGLPERGATPEEKQYALSVFVEDWKNRGDRDQLRFHHDVHENERWRDATLLDRERREADTALLRLREHRDHTLFDLRSRVETGVETSGSGFLKKRVVELDKQVRLTEARIEMLRYAQLVRDWTVSRSTQVNRVKKTFEVGDILRHWSGNELVDRIRSEIAPESWTNAGATVTVVGTWLVVAQQAWVLREIESHLPNLRAEAVSTP